MSRRVQVWIVRRGRCILVRGRNAAELIREAGRTAYYVGTVKAYMLDAEHEADLVALLDHKGIGYEVTALGGDAA